MSESNNQIKGVIFDLDGTTIDSAKDIAAAANEALGSVGLNKLPVEQIEAMTGGGGRNICKRALEACGVSNDRELLKKTYKAFFNYYVDHPVVYTTFYPNVVEALQTLKTQGIKLGVCTNKSQKVSELVVEGLGASDLFEVLIGGDANNFHKPDPRHLEQVISKLGLQASEVAYVGDTEVDLETAIATNVAKYYAVAWARKDAKKEGYSLELADYADLPDLISK